MAQRRSSTVLQFRIELQDIEPAIWRCIQVPSKYSFWDLHVAIQDAMGWLDCHLHVFRVRMPHKRKTVEIGIPMEDPYRKQALAGWEIPVARYFTEPGKSAPYEYDFGDGWHHSVLLEGILLKEEDVKYPRCIAGERACPPEDCGGVPGYSELVEVLQDPKHPEYDGYIGWLKGHVKSYHPYHQDEFDPDKVEFWNPTKRWKMAFSE
jgi:hypothetical protein